MVLGLVVEAEVSILQIVCPINKENASRQSLKLTKHMRLHHNLLLEYRTRILDF
jgi:hypothetical protein